MHNNLIIDIGNTTTKCALFKATECIVDKRFTSLSTLVTFIKKKTYKNAIISSVASKKATQFVIKNVKNPIIFESTTPIPIINKYRTPDTLGADRLANVIASNARFKKQNVLVIDAGTCLKFDFINAEAHYLGGAISLGLRMRFKALNTFTANLPLIKNIEKIPLEGRTTNESMQAGCYNGMLAEIKMIVKEYQEKYKNLKVIFTGGDMPFIENIDFPQKNSIFADRLLTLRGLNEIVEYNAYS